MIDHTMAIMMTTTKEIGQGRPVLEGGDKELMQGCSLASPGIVNTVVIVQRYPPLGDIIDVSFPHRLEVQVAKYAQPKPARAELARISKECC